MPSIRFFALAREIVGASSIWAQGESLDEVLSWASEEYGAEFAKLLAVSAVWVNGEPAVAGQRLRDSDEVAVLPPVSGG